MIIIIYKNPKSEKINHIITVKKLKIGTKRHVGFSATKSAAL